MFTQNRQALWMSSQPFSTLAVPYYGICKLKKNQDTSQKPFLTQRIDNQDRSLAIRLIFSHSKLGKDVMYQETVPFKKHE